jgi:hypothetical protein
MQKTTVVTYKKPSGLVEAQNMMGPSSQEGGLEGRGWEEGKRWAQTT